MLQKIGHVFRLLVEAKFSLLNLRERKKALSSFEKQLVKFLWALFTYRGNSWISINEFPGVA